MKFLSMKDIIYSHISLKIATIANCIPIESWLFTNIVHCKSFKMEKLTLEGPSLYICAMKLNIYHYVQTNHYNFSSLHAINLKLLPFYLLWSTVYSTVLGRMW